MFMLAKGERPWFDAWGGKHMPQWFILLICCKFGDYLWSVGFMVLFTITKPFLHKWFKLYFSTKQFFKGLFFISESPNILHCSFRFMQMSSLMHFWNPFIGHVLLHIWCLCKHWPLHRWFIGLSSQVPLQFKTQLSFKHFSLQGFEMWRHSSTHWYKVRLCLSTQIPSQFNAL